MARRDTEIKAAFRIADDAMQSAIGYFEYVMACRYVANPKIVGHYLPVRLIGDPPQPGYGIRITRNWVRRYDPEDLVNSMDDEVFLSYLARTTIITIISFFEGCLSVFAARLKQKGKPYPSKDPGRDSYKARLTWAFSMMQKSIYGNEEMRSGIPDLCLNVDHARRIRNLWVHNRGNFNERYATDTIPIPGREPTIHPDYKRLDENPQQAIPFALTPELFSEELSWPHIEMLHHLHDTIQRQYFGVKRAYGYGLHKQPIDWRKLQSGSE